MSSAHPFIAMFMNLPEGDREISLRREAFLAGVRQRPLSGLTVAARFGAAQYDTYDRKALELRQLMVDGAGPDLYFACCWPTLKSLQGVASGKPIVFAGLFDLTDNPGQETNYGPNVYGFISYGKNLLAQWPGLLTQIAPMVKRAAVIYDTTSRPGPGVKPFNAIQMAAGQLSSPIPVAGFDIASATLPSDLRHFANASGGPAGLIVAASTLTATVRRMLIDLAATLGLPAIYPNRLYTMDEGNTAHGGLISRGAFLPDLYRFAGGYANQLLALSTPPTKIDITQTGPGAKFETVINLKAAAAIDLTVPNGVLAQADVVIT